MHIFDSNDIETLLLMKWRRKSYWMPVFDGMCRKNKNGY